MKQYFVYIATNYLNSVLYTGITNDLQRRMYEHENKLIPGFTSRYNVTKLVYFDSFPTPLEAIEAEKRIKGWLRKKKIAMIQASNPDFEDLRKLLKE